MQFDLSQLTTSRVLSIAGLSSSLLVSNSGTTQAVTGVISNDDGSLLRADRIATASNGSVVISQTVPTTGMILQASSASAAGWSNILDSTFAIQDNLVSSKRIQFNVGANTPVATKNVFKFPQYGGTLAVNYSYSEFNTAASLSRQSITSTANITNATITTVFSEYLCPLANLYVTNPTIRPLVNICDINNNTQSFLTSVLTDNNVATYVTTPNIANPLDVFLLEYDAPFNPSSVQWNTTDTLNTGPTLSLYGYRNAYGNVTQNYQNFAQPTSKDIVLLYSQAGFIGSGGLRTFPITTYEQFKYYWISMAALGGTGATNFIIRELGLFDSATTYRPLYTTGDIALSLSTSGTPILTKTAATAQYVAINNNSILHQSAFNRIYPLLQSKTQIKLNTDGVTENSIIGNNSTLYIANSVHGTYATISPGGIYGGNSTTISTAGTITLTDMQTKYHTISASSGVINFNLPSYTTLNIGSELFLYFTSTFGGLFSLTPFGTELLKEVNSSYSVFSASTSYIIVYMGTTWVIK
jgi:hypothetical protein